MKLKDLKSILIITLMVMVLNACDFGPAPIEVKLGEICTKELEFKRIVVEGKLIVPDNISEDDIFHYYMYLENADGSIQQQIYISTQSSDSDGNEKNKVRPITSGYDVNDVEIIDKNGDKVMLWGNPMDLDGDFCNIDVSKIEKL